MSAVQAQEEGRPPLEQVPTILVIAVKGGVGKTEVTRQITNRLAKRRKIALFDADIDSPNLPDVMGTNELMELDDDLKYIPTKIGTNIQIFSMRLYVDNEVYAFVQTGSTHNRIIKDGLYYTLWDNPDYVVVDLPAGSSDEFRAIISHQKNIKGIIIVSLPNTLSDFTRVIDLASFFQLPIIGVIENMRDVRCPCGCAHVIPLFSGTDESEIEALCKEHGIHYAGGLPYDPGLHGYNLGSNRDNAEEWTETKMADVFDGIVAVIEGENEVINDGISSETE